MFEKLQPHRLFLLFSLIFGSLFIFLLPPFATPDEPAHLIRSVEFSQGAIFGHGKVPESFKKFVDAGVGIDFSDKTKREERLKHIRTLSEQAHTAPGNLIELPYSRAVVYTPASYLAAIPAIWLSEIMNASPLQMLSLARIFTFLAATALLYAAIRITPILKWPMFFLCLFPTSLYIRSGLNADNLTVGYAFLFFALILFVQEGVKKINLRDVFFLSLLSFLVCLSKNAYVFFPLLLCIVPRTQFTSERIYKLAWVAIVIVPMLAGVAWTFEIKHLLSVTPFPSIENSPMNDIWHRPAGIDEMGQIRWLIEHPIDLLKTLSFAMLLGTPVFIYDMIGKLIVAGISFPAWFSFGMFAGLFYLSDNTPPRIKERLPRRMVAGCFIVMYVGIILLIHIASSPLGSWVVEGVQGRYFLPLVPLLLLIVKKPACTPKTERYWLLVMLLATLISLAYVALQLSTY